MNHVTMNNVMNEGVSSTAQSIVNGLDLAEARLLKQLEIIGDGLPSTSLAMQNEIDQLLKLRKALLEVI